MLLMDASHWFWTGAATVPELVMPIGLGPMLATAVIVVAFARAPTLAAVNCSAVAATAPGLMTLDG